MVRKTLLRYFQKIFWYKLIASSCFIPLIWVLFRLKVRSRARETLFYSMIMYSNVCVHTHTYIYIWDECVYVHVSIYIWICVCLCVCVRMRVLKCACARGESQPANLLIESAGKAEKFFFSLIYSLYSPIVFELCLFVCGCYVCMCGCGRKEKLLIFLVYSLYPPPPGRGTRLPFLSCVCMYVCVMCLYVCVCYVCMCVCERGKVILFVDLLLLLANSFWAVCACVCAVYIVCMQRKEKLFFSLIYSFYSPILFELCLCVCVCVCVVCVCERDRQFSSFRSSTPFSLRWVLSCACVCVCVLWICVCVRKERLFFPSIFSVYSPLICKRCICVMYMCVCVREKRLFLCACVWERRGYSFCWSTWLARLSQIFSKEKASKKIFVYIRGE